MADTSDAIYFAGFFDGEGSVGAYKGRYAVVLTNTDVRPLTQAQAIWGGSLTAQRALGRRYAVRDLWRLSFYGPRGRQFLIDIRPYVRLKGEQIDSYMAILDVLPRWKGQRRSRSGSEIIERESVRLRLLKRGA